MTTDERQDLKTKVDLLVSLRALMTSVKKDHEVWGSTWDIAWKEAVATANDLIRRYAH